MPRLQFWFEIASTYSYLTAMRIEPMAAAAGVEVDWQPFLLGPVFNAQGWTSSPFNVYPAKGRNMVRDMQRMAGMRGLPFVLPEPFPAASLLAMRVATLGMDRGWTAAFAQAAYGAQFGRGEDIGSPDVLGGLVSELGLDAAEVLAAAGAKPVKARLRAATEAAMRLGIFGAPSLVTENGELFWGDDRLEQALAWAVAHHPG
jgi:2-hydroxychromene-2-carboxylate isomerase